VSQISPPIRIVLVAAVVLLAAWMTVLKPKSDSSAPAPATPAGNVNTGKPAVTGFGKDVQAAKGAAAATDKHTAKVFGDGDTQTAAGATTAKGAHAKTTGGTTAVSADLKGLPSGVVTAISKHEVLVLGFITGSSADDRAVRRELRHVDRWDGLVWVKPAPLAHIAAYGRIARGVDVQQSPTIVVVDRKLAATPLVGYVDTRTIDQAVVDALHNSGGMLKVAYLRDVNAVCTRYTSLLTSAPGEAGKPRQRAFVSELAALKAPAGLRAFKRASIADAKGMFAAHGGSRASFRARMDKRHVLACTA
jgi:hypothetical protein